MVMGKEEGGKGGRGEEGGVISVRGASRVRWKDEGVGFRATKAGKVVYSFSGHVRMDVHTTCTYYLRDIILLVFSYFWYKTKYLYYFTKCFIIYEY